MFCTSAPEYTIANVYVRSRHMNTVSIYLTQNIFHSSKFFRTISLNSSHVLLFSMRDMRQIGVFSRTFLDSYKSKKFVAMYKKFILGRPYGYILVDFTQLHRSKLIFRTNIANENLENLIMLYFFFFLFVDFFRYKIGDKLFDSIYLAKYLNGKNVYTLHTQKSRKFSRRIMKFLVLGELFLWILHA